jgi:hypothetical protein
MVKRCIDSLRPVLDIVESPEAVGEPAVAAAPVALARYRDLG